MQGVFAFAGIGEVDVTKHASWVVLEEDTVSGVFLKMRPGFHVARFIDKNLVVLVSDTVLRAGEGFFEVSVDLVQFVDRFAREFGLIQSCMDPEKLKKLRLDSSTEGKEIISAITERWDYFHAVLPGLLSKVKSNPQWANVPEGAIRNAWYCSIFSDIISRRNMLAGRVGLLFSSLAKIADKKCEKFNPFPLPWPYFDSAELKFREFVRECRNRLGDDGAVASIILVPGSRLTDVVELKSGTDGMAYRAVWEDDFGGVHNVVAKKRILGTSSRANSPLDEAVIQFRVSFRFNVLQMTNKIDFCDAFAPCIGIWSQVYVVASVQNGEICFTPLTKYVENDREHLACANSDVADQFYKRLNFAVDLLNRVCGVKHNDLHWGNILVQERDNHLFPTIVDWSRAKFSTEPDIIPERLPRSAEACLEADLYKFDHSGAKKLQEEMEQARLLVTTDTESSPFSLK